MLKNVKMLKNFRCFNIFLKGNILIYRIKQNNIRKNDTI